MLQDSSFKPGHPLLGPHESRRVLRAHDAQFEPYPVRRRVMLEHYSRPGRGRIWTPEDPRSPLSASFTSPGQPNPHRGFNWLAGDIGQQDPFSPQVMWLSHFDGNAVNVVTGFNQTGSKNDAPSVVQQKWGTGSLKCTNSAADNYIRWANQAAFTNLNGSFCIEGWLFPELIGVASQFVLNIRPTAGETVELTFNLATPGILRILIHSGNAQLLVRAMTVSDWNFFAFTADLVGNFQAYLALPGEVTATREASGPGTAVGGLTGGGEFMLGNIATAPPNSVGIVFPYVGYIDDLRLTGSLTKNVQRYTGVSGCTTPTAPFPYP